MHNKELRVADLFCGGGGISEGLKQAGFSIVFGLDNSKPAVETFAHNHPNATVVKSPIEDYSIEDIPEFDILVGGPPCVEFSASKQGRGNILAGLKLVQAFLRVVHYRKPKYWIMENVPKIVMHLPERIPLSWIGVDEPGELFVPVRTHFNTADYGVPQARERFLMGNFPVPSSTHFNPKKDSLLGLVDNKKPWVCLKDVLESLPSPLMNKPDSSLEVQDLNYGIRLPIELVSDHFHEVELPKEEARRIRKAKEAHPFMGWMPFPDVVNRPARTVVATQLGRETLVIGENIDGVDRFRRATVRECAIMQGYPISYQFCGSSLSARYRVVGNGVPPILTFNIGVGIRKDLGLSELDAPCVNILPTELSSPIYNLTKKKASVHKIDRRFSELVPGKEVRGCLVELTNQGNNSSSPQLYSEHDRHIMHWVCRLTIGEGKAKMTKVDLSVEDALKILNPLLQSKKQASALNRMMECVFSDMPSLLCDASTLQSVWIGKKSEPKGPEYIVDRLSEIIDNHFPSEIYSNTFIASNQDYGFLPKKGIRIRLAVSTLAVSFCCDVINDCTNWTSDNCESRYIDPKWKLSKHRSQKDLDTVITQIKRTITPTHENFQLADKSTCVA